MHGTTLGKLERNRDREREKYVRVKRGRVKNHEPFAVKTYTDTIRSDTTMSITANVEIDSSTDFFSPKKEMDEW